jgi:hypothetical protein
MLVKDTTIFPPFCNYILNSKYFNSLKRNERLIEVSKEYISETIEHLNKE